MPYRRHRMIQHHPWTSPSHHFSHTLTHFRLIAVHWTLLAGRLLISELTSIKTLFCICYMFRALLTQLLISLESPAVESYHHPYRLLLALYPVHHIINIILPSAKQKVCGAWVTT